MVPRREGWDGEALPFSVRPSPGMDRWVDGRIPIGDGGSRNRTHVATIPNGRSLEMDRWALRSGWRIAWIATGALGRCRSESEAEEGGTARGKDPHATAKWRIHTDRARDLCNRGRYAEAEAWLRNALEEAKEGFGEEDSHVAAAKQNLADLFRLQGRSSEAEELYRESLVLLISKEGSQHPSVGALLDHMGLFYAQVGNWEESERRLREALRIKKESLGASHPEYASTLSLLGETLAKGGKIDAAISVMEESIKIVESTGLVPWIVANKRMQKMISLLVQSGRFAEAKQWHERQIQELELHSGATHPRVALALESFGMELAHHGNASLGRYQMGKAQKIWEDTGRHSIPHGRVLRRMIVLRLALDGEAPATDEEKNELEVSTEIARRSWAKSLERWKSRSTDSQADSRDSRYSLHMSAEEYCKCLLLQVLLHRQRGSHQEQDEDALKTCTHVLQELRTSVGGIDGLDTISHFTELCSAAGTPPGTCKNALRANIINIL